MRVFSYSFPYSLWTRYEPPVPHATDRFSEIQLLEPASEARPYTSIIDGETLHDPEIVDNATRQWAAGVAARARSGQILSGSNAFGTEVSPITMPEAVRGRMVAVSI